MNFKNKLIEICLIVGNIRRIVVIVDIDLES